MSETTDVVMDASSPAVLDDIVRSSVETTIAEQTPAAELPQRDASGKFTKPASAEAPADEPVVEAPLGDDSTVAPDEPLESVPSPDEGAEAKLPEGMVAVPKIDGRELATAFTVLDAEGELEPPDLTIKFTANGKERSEPLDKVVKLAQMGVYNQERDQQTQAARVESQRVAQTNQQLLQRMEQFERDREALLTDDNYYLNTRARYETENTPEMRQQRQQEVLQDREAQFEFNQVAAEGSRFFDTQLAPAVEQITNALPLVSAEEIGAKLLLVTSRFQVHTKFGSIVPPARYGDVQQAIVEDILPWAQQVQDHRATERTASTQKTEAEKLALQKAADAERINAQKKTALLTRGTKPGQARVASDTPKPKKLVTVDDHLEDAVTSAVKLAMAG